MKKLVIVLWVSATAVCAPSTVTRLLLFGGGAIPEVGAQRFVQLAGGQNARILFIPWASSAPDAAFDYFSTRVGECFPAEVVRAEPFEKVKLKPKEFTDSLSRYTGVFFSGGDQNLVMDNLEEATTIRSAFVAQFKKGIVFSGTSAGLAMMSSTMLTGDADVTELDPKAVKTRTGLGLLEGVVLDQHFIRRNRMQRLVSVMLGSTERYGIGVDENTGIYIESGKEPASTEIEVVGERKVVLIDKGEMAGKMVLEIQKPGDRFTLADFRKSEPME